MKYRERLRVSSKILLRKEKEGVFLFDPEDGNLLCINQLGYFIWQHCDGKHTSEEIVDLIHDNCPDVSMRKIREDFEEFVNQLKELEFLI